MSNPVNKDGLPHGPEDDVITGISEPRKRRGQGLERLVLIFSDQQLVTGLAMLTAGYIKRYSMSTYNFDIITALAWLSSTAHLSTLAVLRV